MKTDKLIDEIRSSYFEEGDLRRKIEEIRRNRRRIENLLYIECQHEFVRDNTAPFDDICRNVCKICGLYDNPNLYVMRYNNK